MLGCFTNVMIFLFLIKTTESINHFRWLDRSTHIIEEDQIVFPDEAVFEKVGLCFPSCHGFCGISWGSLAYFNLSQVEKSKGRVYLLRFKHDDRRFFYWMQVRDMYPFPHFRFFTLVYYSASNVL